MPSYYLEQHQANIAAASPKCNRPPRAPLSARRLHSHAGSRRFYASVFGPKRKTCGSHFGAGPRTPSSSRPSCALRQLSSHVMSPEPGSAAAIREQVRPYSPPTRRSHLGTGTFPLPASAQSEKLRFPLRAAHRHPQLTAPDCALRQLSSHVMSPVPGSAATIREQGRPIQPADQPLPPRSRPLFRFRLRPEAKSFRFPDRRPQASSTHDPRRRAKAQAEPHSAPPALFDLVSEAGLEPARLSHTPLKRTRLRIRHSDNGFHDRRPRKLRGVS